MLESMRLKTKLVLAITGLVFLIAGLLSLVYVSHLVNAAVQQSYDTNRMVANQVRFALQNALETGLKDKSVDPNDPCRAARASWRKRSATTQRSNAVIDSANLYSLDRLRHQHRRYAIPHPDQHSSRQRRQAAAGSAELRRTARCRSNYPDAD